MNIEAPSKLWILCCVCCCGNTGQRLFCVTQWYCINIPEYVHTIAAQAIMLLFNWKLIKYINKNRRNLFFFCFPQQLLNQFIFIFHYFIAFLCVFASYCQYDKNIAGAQHTSGMSHLASQISLSLSLALFSVSIITFFSPWARAGLSGVTSIAGMFFPFSHDAPGGDMAISGPVREAVSASPRGWGRGLTVEMSLSLSLSHKQRPGH